MELSVKIRNQTGKAIKSLRKKGAVPAVVYGKSLETPLVISCIKNDFIKVYKHGGYSTPIDLVGEVKQLVLLHDMQLDPVTDEVLALDFLAVSRTEKVTTSVPILLVGESKIEKMGEGNIQLVKDEVEVEAFPQDLPQNIEVDIGVIENLYDVVFVKDLKVSNKVQILDDPEQPIITVLKISEEEEQESEGSETGEQETEASESVSE